MIKGGFDSPSIGLVLYPTIQPNADGRSGTIRFTAMSDGTGAVSPCFSCVLPHIKGRIVRLSCYGIYGALTTATATLTLTDESGATWTGTVTTSGNKDTLGAVSAYFDGRLRLSFDTFGAANKQLDIVIHVAEPLQTSTAS